METTVKTQIYNVIILDKSGSMSSIVHEAIDGVNETIASIKRSQDMHLTQENYLTLVAFCGCEIKKIYEQCPIGEVRPISTKDYRPCCMTPLYDAIGATIIDVHNLMQGNDNAIACVTIITDGYENASKEFSHRAIKSLIEAYKSEGWLFAYIGAEHDVESVSYSLSIDNRLWFDKSHASINAMFGCLRKSRDRFIEEVGDIMSLEESADNKRERIVKSSKNFFKK